MPRAGEDVTRPEGDRAIACRAGEVDAGIDQLSADPETACPRLDQQQAELRLFITLVDDEDAPGESPIELGDPGALALRVEALDDLAEIVATSASNSTFQPNSAA
jgi:hypothetical protein